MKLKQIQKRIGEITKFLNDQARIEDLRKEGISADGIKARLEEENRPKIAELKVLEREEKFTSSRRQQNITLSLGVATIIVSAIVVLVIYLL